MPPRGSWPCARPSWASWRSRISEEIEQAQAKLAHAQALLDFRQAKMDRSTSSLGTSVSRELFEEDSSLCNAGRGQRPRGPGGPADVHRAAHGR